MINFLFFEQEMAYDIRISYWSSDVCSSDLWDEIIVSEIINVVIMLAALLASALGFAICAFALFALSFLAAVGPLFVAALLFDSTRPFFSKCLGSNSN